VAPAGRLQLIINAVAGLVHAIENGYLLFVTLCRSLSIRSAVMKVFSLL